MIDDFNKKINEIDLLLTNDKVLDRYINNIESEKFEVPKELKNNIMLKINQSDYEIISKRHEKYRYDNIFSILKIVACTIFAIIIWYKMPNDYNLDTIEIENNYLEAIDLGNESKINEKINVFGEKINEFFMSPKNLKGGNK